MTLIIAAKFVVYGTCLFLIPFWFKAYFDPMSPLNLGSIGLVPSETNRLTGLSNIRGSVGGLRLGIIAMMGIGAYFQRPDLCLGAAILVGAVAVGRFLSLPLDGWNRVSFITALSEVVMVASLLYVGGFIG